jgi:hypothetical protein
MKPLNLARSQVVSGKSNGIKKPRCRNTQQQAYNAMLWSILVYLGHHQHFDVLCVWLLQHTMRRNACFWNAHAFIKWCLVALFSLLLGKLIQLLDHRYRGTCLSRMHSNEKPNGGYSQHLKTTLKITVYKKGLLHPRRIIILHSSDWVW